MTDNNLPTENLDDLVDLMTLEEQVSLLSGQDFWSVAPVERLGIGTLRVTDGPNGARGAGGGGSILEGVPSACFPCGIALGATWDPDLVEEIGSALADETKSKNAHMLLAPTVNIHRSVTNGRNFECYSEDPELTAALATSYVTGLQAKGVGATIKHFAGNESEIERTTMNSVISERALREVYLRPFEDAVKIAGTWGVMTSYNRLNGPFSSESEWLLSGVLRGDWGYQGMVMSDWYGSHSTEPTVTAGLDLEMPGPTRDRGDKLVEAVRAGKVSEATIRERALNMLRILQKTGALHNHAEHVERSDDRPEHRALIRKVGAAGTVLLKNDRKLLPLHPSIQKIAVIGPNAKTARIMGGGSATITPYYAISPYEAIAERFGEENVAYAKGCDNHRFEPLWTGEIKAEFFDNQKLEGEPVHTEILQRAEAFWGPPLAGGKVDPRRFSVRMTGSFTPSATDIHRFGVNAAGFVKLYVDGELVVDAHTNWENGRTFFEEGCDPVIGGMELEAGRSYAIKIEFVSNETAKLVYAAFRVGIGSPMKDKDIADAALVAHDCDVALIFVGRSGEWDTEGSDLETIKLPGRQDELVTAVATANPRTIVILQTGGPVEMPWEVDVSTILEAWYPGQEAGNAIADVLFGDAEPGGRLPQTFPMRWQDNPTSTGDAKIYPGKDGTVRYEEGVFVGYRHYLEHNIKPLYPFGHGLGYTEFDLSEPVMLTSDNRAEIAFDLKNVGERKGSTVVQLYVQDLEASVQRPRRELKTFRKVELAAGEKSTIKLALKPRDFAFFDEAERLWRVEAGDFRIEIGFSATDIRKTAMVTLKDQTIPV
ncbi:glycoside hydrolase family 3 C-terminal domain-containing protein [uncultured Cohaesibacter sp.]|uniref:beta-glucosidase n=1 Tax=uncultured Cohaesibacter sp. TaxID=1002546 RepID=UPI0029C621A3|nr:glycoside hydrolase family 3 C-terminal domain-containing protein [uncultured Cohaesibacter sp.]